MQFGTVFGMCTAGTKGTFFDVIFADEAGQMSLADALAVSHSARSMVLLGDPLHCRKSRRPPTNSDLERVFFSIS